MPEPTDSPVSTIRTILVGVLHRAKNIELFLANQEFDKTVRQETLRTASFLETEVEHLRKVVQDYHNTNNTKRKIGECYDCGFSHDWYMLKDEVWLQAWPEGYKELRTKLTLENQGRRVFVGLCYECLEKRLGRMLTIDDFDLGIPINSGIRMGFKLGLRDEMGHRQGTGVIRSTGSACGLLDSSNNPSQEPVEATQDQTQTG